MVTAHQFEVYRVKGLRPESPVDLVVILQNDVLDHLTTRVVAPLLPLDENYRIDRVVPAVEIENIRYAVAMHLVATIPVRNLGTMVGTLDAHEVALKSAIDMVFSGV